MRGGVTPFLWGLWCGSSSDTCRLLLYCQMSSPPLEYCENSSKRTKAFHKPSYRHHHSFPGNVSICTTYRLHRSGKPHYGACSFLLTAEHNTWQLFNMSYYTKTEITDQFQVRTCSLWIPGALASSSAFSDFSALSVGFCVCSASLLKIPPGHLWLSVKYAKGI